MKDDTPIALANITQMSPEEREALVGLIRERRLAPVRAYEELSLMQVAVRREQLEDQYTKHMGMFVKNLASADKAMDTLEKRSTKLRVIMLELEEL